MKKNIVQINFKSVDTSINNYIVFVLNILKKTKTTYSQVFMPKKIKKITLLKSPHVNKKAREQFQLKKLKNVIFFKIDDKAENLLNFLILNKPKFIKINMRRII